MDALVWDIKRRVRREVLPSEPFVTRIELTDLRGRAGRRFLLMRPSEVSLCATNRATPRSSCCAPTDARSRRGGAATSRSWRMGLTLEGDRALVRKVPEIFERYALAGVAAAG